MNTSQTKRSAFHFADTDLDQPTKRQRSIEDVSFSWSDKTRLSVVQGEEGPWFQSFLFQGVFETKRGLQVVLGEGQTGGQERERKGNCHMSITITGVIKGQLKLDAACFFTVYCELLSALQAQLGASAAYHTKKPLFGLCYHNRTVSECFTSITLSGCCDVLQRPAS